MWTFKQWSRKRERLPVAPLAGVLLAVICATPARATCGSAYCFLDTGTREGLQLKGAFRVDLSYQFVNQSRKRAGSDDVDEVLTPKVNFEQGEIELDHHREIRTDNTLFQLDASYGVNERLSVYVHLPLVNNRDHEHYDEVGTPEESFTRQDGSSGFGDVRVGARYGLPVGHKDLVVGNLALKLPTGAHTLRDSEGSINEPTIQPGTGSTDWIGGVRWSRQVAPRRLDLFVTASYRLNTENDLDYEFGDERVLTAGFQRKVGDAGPWTWSLQLNARSTGRDRFLGERIPSTGADLVNLSPGLRYTASTGTELYAFVQYPVYQEVNEAQLTPRAGILLGISRTF